MAITIALAGNPNSGKSTLFNRVTGSNQYVGNWPGVTVEKKTGKYVKDKEIAFTDLPGTYSLSPYTLEEMVSRDYLLNEHPDVIIDVIDASNIERNMYLATQLSELGIPLVLALNMMDVVRKNGDTINVKAIEEKLGCKIVEISALKGENIDALIRTAKEMALKKDVHENIKAFSPKIEDALAEIEGSVAALKNHPSKRFIAVKLLERDGKADKLIKITAEEKAALEKIIAPLEEAFDDDGEGIITDERYEFVTGILSGNLKKGRTGLTRSDKIDKVVTNRFLALPIFALIMYGVYWLAVGKAAGPINDWWADDVMGALPDIVGGWLEGAGASAGVTSLVADGIVGGVSAVVGFLPVIAIFFLLISILEDVGYMSRIAFILDRVFRKVGLSGKSFIPILMGLGCSVSGITGTRTIENDNDRRMTIICASFMPCGAKMDYIAMFAAVFAGAWYGVLWYFIGLAAVIISGVILKKTKKFHGDPAPFVMELPEYHLPSARNVFRATWDRCKAFLVKAGTIILLCSVAIWFLQNITTDFQFVTFGEEVAGEESILAAIGKSLAWIFKPLGFGNWIAAVASVLGLVAKEELVGVLEILGGGTDKATIMSVFGTNIAVLSFMIFNQLTIPCFAALGAIKEEMGTRSWYRFAIAYLLGFSYLISLAFYQIASFVSGEGSFGVGTVIGFVIAAVIVYLMARKNPYENVTRESASAVELMDA